MPLSKYDIQLEVERSQGTSHGLMIELVGANKRVLDVGCDTGYLGEALSAFGNETSGFEVDPATAEQARSRLARVEVGDLETTDLVEVFGPASFDIVVFGDVLEHLRDPLSVLRQARGLLAPGGSVVISTPNVAHGDVRLALLKGRFNYTKLGILDETHTRFFTRDSLVRFLHDAGFVLLELRRTQLGLFDTEIELDRAEFDPAVIAQVAADPESTTYQFVLRAAPDDAVQITSEQALALDSVSRELQAQRLHNGRLAAQIEDLSAEHLALTARIAELGAELAARGEELAERDAEIAALQVLPPPSPAARAVRKARRIAGELSRGA
ncbi:MAG TPA: class I SAM-dependent methyltransferase [Jatrophihabitantaceae bacterium]|jgi:2-polyprenyl-3-methyl-5-hydroxy-6-metoxy-1,4-benzoquinol methylase|nr:class I SAM-dependent methyltransferase [Jatrophihabitantaceae bacterium]